MARGPLRKKDMLPALHEFVGDYRPDVDDVGNGTIEYSPYKSRKVNSQGGRPRLRPSIHDPGMLEKIAARIIRGDGILSFMEDKEYKFPCRSEFYKELSLNPNSKFSTGIRLAREAAHYAINDFMRQMVDTMKPEDKDIVKVRLDWYKWHLGNLYPEIYGEKRQISMRSASDKQPVDITPREFEDIAYKIVEDV